MAYPWKGYTFIAPLQGEESVWKDGALTNEQLKYKNSKLTDTYKIHLMPKEENFMTLFLI